MNAKQIFVASSIISVLIITFLYPFIPSILWALIIIGPIILIGINDITQTKHSIRRNYPVVGNFRYMLENIRPEIMQYFVETDTEGRPINRLFRSLVYERAKKNQ